MLQVIIEEHDKYTPAEQAQMALEGGCTWLVMRTINMDDAEIREQAREIVPLCREQGAILTFEGHPDIATELGVHGLLLHVSDQPPLIRQQLGPEAILGAECNEVARVIDYDKADIDYIALTCPNPSEVIAEARTADVLIPFVAFGDYGIDDVAMLKFAGFNGVCTGRKIFDAEDPVEYVSRFLDALEHN